MVDPSKRTYSNADAAAGGFDIQTTMDRRDTGQAVDASSDQPLNAAGERAARREAERQRTKSRSAERGLKVHLRSIDRIPARRADVSAFSRPPRCVQPVRGPNAGEAQAPGGSGIGRDMLPEPGRTAVLETVLVSAHGVTDEEGNASPPFYVVVPRSGRKV